MPAPAEPTGLIKPQRGIPRDGRKIVTKAERVARALPDAEFHIPGHIVADIVIDERLPIAGRSPAVTQFRITALTIEDW